MKGILYCILYYPAIWAIYRHIIFTYDHDWIELRSFEENDKDFYEIYKNLEILGSYMMIYRKLGDRLFESYYGWRKRRWVDMLNSESIQ